MSDEFCRKCGGVLVDHPYADTASCVKCNTTYTFANLATIWHPRIGLEREGWDTPPEAA